MITHGILEMRAGNRIRSGRRRRMRGAFTTCMGTFGNGARTDMGRWREEV